MCGAPSLSVDIQQRSGASLSQISGHLHKSPWRTKARCGLTSLWPNTHTRLAKGYMACLSGASEQEGALPPRKCSSSSLLTSRLLLHNWPSRVLKRPCLVYAACRYSQGVSESDPCRSVPFSLLYLSLPCAGFGSKKVKTRAF